MIQPIDCLQRQQVIQATRSWESRAQHLFDIKLAPVEVLFDLMGKSAGMFRVKNSVKQIRYNPWLFASDFGDNMGNTVPHEVAHYVADTLYGSARIQPHGSEWQNIMLRFDVEPSRTCNYDMTGVPTRRYRTFPYRCACRDHELKTRRHNQVVNRLRQYICRRCGETLVFQPAD